MDRQISRGCLVTWGFYSQRSRSSRFWDRANTSQIARRPGRPPPDPVVIDQPPRDRPPARPRVDTAVVKGRVVDGVTGNPVARARVRMMGGSIGQKPPVTDANGGFAFTALPQGGYSLTVEKSRIAGAIPGRHSLDALADAATGRQRRTSHR